MKTLRNRFIKRLVRTTMLISVISALNITSTFASTDPVLPSINIEEIAHDMEQLEEGSADDEDG